MKNTLIFAFIGLLFFHFSSCKKDEVVKNNSLTALDSANNFLSSGVLKIYFNNFGTRSRESASGTIALSSDGTGLASLQYSTGYYYTTAGWVDNSQSYINEPLTWSCTKDTYYPYNQKLTLDIPTILIIEKSFSNFRRQTDTTYVGNAQTPSGYILLTK